MNKILLGALATLAFGATTGALVASAGLIDVGADTPHSQPVVAALGFVRERAIARRVADLAPPADLADPERVRRGAGNYDAMCVECHLAPGLPDSEIRRGLYPTPPNLALPGEGGAAGRNPARDFWIIKHGIKASGMPAWSKGGMEDEAIWDLAAFLQTLPTLSLPAYRELVAASDGHSHGGMDAHAAPGEAAPPPAPATPSGKTAAPARKAHSHDHAHDHTAHKH